MSKSKISDPLAKVTLALPVTDALYLARAGVAAVSMDDVTPTITGVLLSATGGIVKALATDRYRVHRATAGVKDVPDFPPFLIPNKALRWMIANAGFFGRGLLPAVVHVEIEPSEARTEPNGSGGVPTPNGSVTLTVREGDFDGAGYVSHKAALIKGMFPGGIEKLVDEALEADTDTTDSGTLNLDFLSKCRALSSYNGERPRIRFVPPTGKHAGTGKALVIYRHGVALIQKGTDER